MNNRLILSAMEFNNMWIQPSDTMNISKSISIIIPVYYPEHLKEAIAHLASIGGFKEIVLVDDSGKIKEQDYSFLNSFENISVYYHVNNLGRSAARNTGASYAKGDILVFLDQDMFLDPSFLETARKYYAKNESLIFLGLRDTLWFENIPNSQDWIRPPKTQDWRIRTVVMPKFVDLTVLGVGNENNRCFPGEVISIFEKTKQLTDMGITIDKTIGFWDLPSMVISHSMAINKKDFYRIGGFPEWIKGWGGEDIVFGFLACAAHIPIFISDCVSYQALHNPYSGSENIKMAELIANIEKYRIWAKDAKEFPVFDLQKTKVRAQVLKI